MGNIVQTRYCLCQMESSGSPQFYCSRQTDRGKGLGFFSCLVSHLNLYPKKILCGNTPTSRPSDPDPHGILHCAQLQFLQEFLFATLGPPSLQALASHSLLQTTYWVGHFQAAHILGFIDAQSRGIHPNIGKLTIGHKLYRQQIPAQGEPWQCTGSGSNIPYRGPLA